MQKSISRLLAIASIALVACASTTLDTVRQTMDAGIKPSRMTFYVLIGYWSTPAQDLHRVEVLREYGCDPYVMPYDKFDRYQIDFARWVNYKVKFKTMTFPEYMKNQQGRHKDDRTIQLFEVN